MSHKDRVSEDFHLMLKEGSWLYLIKKRLWPTQKRLYSASLRHKSSQERSSTTRLLMKSLFSDVRSMTSRTKLRSAKSKMCSNAKTQVNFTRWFLA